MDIYYTKFGIKFRQHNLWMSKILFSHISITIQRSIRNDFIFCHLLIPYFPEWQMIFASCAIRVYILFALLLNAWKPFFSSVCFFSFFNTFWFFGIHFHIIYLLESGYLLSFDQKLFFPLLTSQMSGNATKWQTKLVQFGPCKVLVFLRVCCWFSQQSLHVQNHWREWRWLNFVSEMVMIFIPWYV